MYKNYILSTLFKILVPDRPLQNWADVPVLYSSSLSVFYFIYSSLYVSIPIFQFISPPIYPTPHPTSCTPAPSSHIFGFIRDNSFPGLTLWWHFISMRNLLTVRVNLSLLKVYPDLTQPGTCRLMSICKINGKITEVIRKNKQAMALP